MPAASVSMFYYFRRRVADSLSCMLSTARRRLPHWRDQSRSVQGLSFLGLLVLSLLIFGCRGRAGHATASTRASIDGPKIAFATTVHDFGTVIEGDKLRHVFVVKNTGNAPLLIDGAHASCGCTVAALKSKSIEPGGTSEIDASVNTHGKVGPSRTTITVDSNAKDQPHVTLTLTATLERLLAFESGYVRVATDYGVAKTERVLLTGKLLDKATPQVAKVESQRRGDSPVEADKDPILAVLSVRLFEEQAGDTKRKGLELKLKGDRISAGSGKVTLATGLPNPAQLELNLTWGVTSTLQVDPDSLNFAEQPGGHQRVLRVSSRKPDFRLARVRVLDGPFTAAIDGPASNGAFKVNVTWNAPPPGGHSESNVGKLQLISNDPAEPKKVVEMRVVTAP